MANKINIVVLCIPTFSATGERIWRYRGNVSFGPMSKNNIGMAALRAGLPQIFYRGKGMNGRPRE